MLREPSLSEGTQPATIHGPASSASRAKAEAKLLCLPCSQLHILQANLYQKVFVSNGLSQSHFRKRLLLVLASEQEKQP